MTVAAPTSSASSSRPATRPPRCRPCSRRCAASHPRPARGDRRRRRLDRRHRRRSPPRTARRVVRIDGVRRRRLVGQAVGLPRRARAAATGTDLLFLDADVRLRRRRARRALAGRTRPARRAGLGPAPPRHRTRATRSCRRTCNVVAMMGSGAFAPWPPAAPAVAFGPCLLTSAPPTTPRVGGHAAVRGEVIEDVAPRPALSPPPGCRSLPSPAATLVRSACTPAASRQLVDGWTKNLAAGAGAASIRSPWSATRVVGRAHASRVGLAGVDAGSSARVGGRPTRSVAAAGWSPWPSSCAGCCGRVGTFRWWTAVAVPGAAGWRSSALFARSAWLDRRAPARSAGVDARGDRCGRGAVTCR